MLGMFLKKPKHAGGLQCALMSHCLVPKTPLCLFVRATLQVKPLFSPESVILNEHQYRILLTGHVVTKC